MIISAFVFQSQNHTSPALKTEVLVSRLALEIIKYSIHYWWFAYALLLSMLAADERLRLLSTVTLSHTAM